METNSRIIFVRTRHVYGSYVDFFKLAELSDYPIIFVDEMLQHDSKDTIFIISPVNGEWNQRPKGYTQGKVILFQLEWNWDGEHNTPACVDEVWNSDVSHAQRNGFKYVPMGSHEGLNEIGSEFPIVLQFDIVQLSYQTYRRQIITAKLEDSGLRLAPNGGIWGRNRSAVLMGSYAMLHTHQREDTIGVAPLRWCIAAAHNLPMITETVIDRGIFGYSTMVQSDYQYLAAFAANMLKDKRLLADYAAGLHDLLCRDYTFKVSVDSHV